MSTPDEQLETLIRLVNEMSQRQLLLESRMDALEGTKRTGTTQAEVVEPAAQFIAGPPVIVGPEAPLESPSAAVDQISTEGARPAIESKVGLTLINRLGVVTLVLGVGFFFKWAVDNNWIGPTGRVVLGLLAGFAALAAADVLWRKGQQVFAQGITGTGAAIVYLSFFAAFDFYHLISQTLAFALLVTTTGMATALALRYSAQAIACISLLGAYLVPLLLSNGEDHPWFLISYLLLINVVATELAKRRHWMVVEVLSFAASTLIFARWSFSNGYKEENRAPRLIGALALGAQRFRTPLPILFLLTQAFTTILVGTDAGGFRLVALLVTVLGGLAFAHWRRYLPVAAAAFSSFWFVSSFSAEQRMSFLLADTAGFAIFTIWTWWRLVWLCDEKPKLVDVVICALNGAAYFAIAYARLHVTYHHWLGFLAVAIAGLYLGFGASLYRRRSRADSDVLTLTLGLSLAFLALAIPIQLTGFSIAIAWSIQGAGLTWIGVRLRSVNAIVGALAIFALAALHLAYVDSIMYENASSYSLLFNARFLAFTIFALALIASAYWIAGAYKAAIEDVTSEGMGGDRKLALVPFAAGHLAMLVGLGLEVVGWAERTSSASSEPSREMLGITILMALYAVMMVAIGVLRRSAVHRIAGLLLTGIVVLKLYLLDVWQLGRVYQILAFVVLGILLLSTSFLYSRFKGLIDEWKHDEKTNI